jgi:beta-1,4-mannosyltransferase
MKVVDMFGCGMPVLARNFACLDELVQDGVNGRVFDTPEELAAVLMSTLQGFPVAPELEKLRAYFMRSGTNFPSRRIPRPGVEAKWSTWDENWDAIMKRGVLDFARY